MTNNDIIREFISGSKNYNATNHLGYFGNNLINYSTVICEINRNEKTALVNTRKYSTTTSKIQSALIRELESAGYTIETTSGEPARAWNYGYQGAERVKASDMESAYYIYK